jgi:hypothetical protein
MAADSAKFKFEFEVEARKLPFQPSSMLTYLDLAALAKMPSAKVDLGSFKTNCCDRHVYAVIENGKVVRLDSDPCSESNNVTPELGAVLELAFKKMKMDLPGKWKPLPVAKFFAAPQEISVGTITCIQICVWGHCIVCCTTQIPDTPFWCGDRVIIQRDPVRE